MSKEKNVNIDFNEQKQRFSLTLLFGAVVFLILLTAIVLSVIAMFWLVWLGVIGGPGGGLRLGSVLLFMSCKIGRAHV